MVMVSSPSDSRAGTFSNRCGQSGHLVRPLSDALEVVTNNTKSIVAATFSFHVHPKQGVTIWPAASRNHGVDSGH